ncbi:hypothetical protein HPHPP4D_0401 [Helicobacter pylori Hp P-4d]|uniref:Uncharacterized protein n=1 Tax=Helicobacter pylori Hp P-4 TaxID=992075 RepID=I9WIX1_HELPX|nr:hypothetical protein HPHPP4_0367 [Helicobacter pylori Hp P-4]EJC24454.1 hypothetical protein HPHPP4C_0403 [Helicobacter pylori Hp P-4c]EJC25669.1 hypothetical protein HPHPP4D_0401 [Helicobacter pylori Hp P-4d]
MKAKLSPQHQSKKAQIPLAFGRFTFTMDYKMPLSLLAFHSIFV